MWLENIMVLGGEDGVHVQCTMHRLLTYIKIILTYLFAYEKWPAFNEDTT